MEAGFLLAAIFIGVNVIFALCIGGAVCGGVGGGVVLIAVAWGMIRLVLMLVLVIMIVIVIVIVIVKILPPEED